MTLIDVVFALPPCPKPIECNNINSYAGPSCCQEV